MGDPKIMSGSLIRQSLKPVDDAVSYGQIHIRKKSNANGLSDGLVSKQDLRTTLSNWSTFSNTLPKHWDQQKRDQLHTVLSRIERSSRQQGESVLMDYRSPEPVVPKPTPMNITRQTVVKPKSISWQQLFGLKP